MRLTITKEFEGKTVYALPTGNNARLRQKESAPEEFKVLKVKRKYVELQQGRHTDNYDPTTGCTQSQINAGYRNNSGYMFFESPEAIDRYKVYQKKHGDILNHFRSLGRSPLDENQVEKIYEILFGQA